MSDAGGDDGQPPMPGIELLADFEHPTRDRERCARQARDPAALAVGERTLQVLALSASSDRRRPVYAFSQLADGVLYKALIALIERMMSRHLECPNGRL